MEMSLDLFVRMLYALGVGVLIGLERSMGTALELRAREEKGSEDAASEQPGDGVEAEFMGVRSFSVLSLLGFTAALLAAEMPAAAAILVAGGVLLVMGLYLRTPQLPAGITTELAAICSCGLGALCVAAPHTAGVLALAITVLLAAKRFTHSTVRRLRRVELTDTLKFLVIILIVLPLLPNEALDPYGAFNPWKITFLVVLISGISFVGYFLTKFLGAERGLGLTGLLGGLTSSTAVTAAMAAQARQQPDLRGPCAFATVLANATMFGRVLVVVALLDRALALKLAWSLGTMTVAACIGVGVLWLLGRKQQSAGASSEVSLSNPFSLGPAIKFAAFFVAILFVAKLAKLWFGDSGLYLAALVSGLADVDAITLSIAEQTRAELLDYGVGALAITIAVASNGVVKTGIAIYAGGWRFGWLVGLVLALATGAGIGVLLVV